MRGIPASLWLFALLCAGNYAFCGKRPGGNELYRVNLSSDKIDSIAVHKANHEMLVFSRGVLLKKYIVQLGKHPVGRKECFGDGKTPEGHYYITTLNAQSLFHRSLKISYPDNEDIERAIRLGRSPGGDIMIHGLPNGEEHARPNRYRNDWANGCIAVRNAEIE